MDAAVKNVYDNYPPEYRSPLLDIRKLIFNVADRHPEIGPIEESLKWGQPTYTAKTGTPIRLDRFKVDKIAVFVHCQTTLIEDFRTLFQDALTFSKTRAIVLDPGEALPMDALALFIERALSYHSKKNK